MKCIKGHPEPPDRPFSFPSSPETPVNKRLQRRSAPTNIYNKQAPSRAWKLPESVDSGSFILSGIGGENYRQKCLPEQHRPDECGICILYGCAGRRIRTRRAAGPTRIRKARQNHGCTHGGNPRYTEKGLLLLHGLNQTPGTGKHNRQPRAFS